MSRLRSGRRKRLAELLALGVSGDPSSGSSGFSVPETSAPGLTGTLIEDGVATEAVVLSAGHLTELYLVAEDALTAEASALAELALWTGLNPALLAESAYALEENSAASHLFRIAAGFGCPAPGVAPAREPIERAHRIARDAGSAGPVLDRLFTDASEVAASAPSGATAAGMPAAVDELEVRRWERRVSEEVERFVSWRTESRDGELTVGESDYDRASGASVLRFPRPGDAA